MVARADNGVGTAAAAGGTDTGAPTVAALETRRRVAGIPKTILSELIGTHPNHWSRVTSDRSVEVDREYRRRAAAVLAVTAERGYPPEPGLWGER